MRALLTLTFLLMLATSSQAQDACGYLEGTNEHEKQILAAASAAANRAVDDYTRDTEIADVWWDNAGGGGSAVGDILDLVFAGLGLTGWLPSHEDRIERSFYQAALIAQMAGSKINQCLAPTPKPENAPEATRPEAADAVKDFLDDIANDPSFESQAPSITEDPVELPPEIETPTEMPELPPELPPETMPEPPPVEMPEQPPVYNDPLSEADPGSGGGCYDCKEGERCFAFPC